MNGVLAQLGLSCLAQYFDALFTEALAASLGGSHPPGIRAGLPAELETTAHFPWCDFTVPLQRR
jgi:hypothetical protein